MAFNLDLNIECGGWFGDNVVFMVFSYSVWVGFFLIERTGRLNIQPFY